MDGPLKRIVAASKLWDDGLKEDSAALIFIAAAAVSRLRYPRDKYTDRESFLRFVRDEIATITCGATLKTFSFPKTTSLPGIRSETDVPLEEVFYATWRCVLIHEARWPQEVYLTETRLGSDYPTYIDITTDGRLGLPEQWILGFARAVESAPEVAGQE